MNPSSARSRPDEDAARDAFLADLFRRSQLRLLGVARRALRCDTEAEDAVQDAWLAVVRASDRFEGRAKVDTWLFRVVLNAALMRRRARNRRRAVLDSECGHRLADAPDQRSSQIFREEEREDAHRLVVGGIEHLSATHRAVLALRDLNELGVEQTARRLGISRMAVRARHFRARAALRKVLAPDSPSRDESEGTR